MSSAISPDIEAYGRYARVSLLADYLELLALNGFTTRSSALADYISDNDWDMPELIVPAGPQEAGRVGQDDATDAADRVFALMLERAEILMDLYPFEVSDDEVRWRGSASAETSPYVGLLAITTTHAYQIEAPSRPYEVFEQAVADVLTREGLRSVNFGDLRRGGGSFEEALDVAASVVGLRAAPSGVLRKRDAKDEKVDTICHFEWGDTRPGIWVMIGQATCGKSESWESKIHEPRPPTWGLFLNALPRPQVFLAVPHHAEPSFLEKLVQDNENIVLDRLRLCRFKESNSQKERDLVRLIRSTDLDRI